MTSLGEMENQFNDLQSLSDSQFRQISDLKKQLKVLKEENEALKVSSPSCLQSVSSDTGISNEELICLTQIAILKDRAITRELLLEECKKLSLLYDILTAIKKNTPNHTKISVERLSSEELLALMNDTETQPNE